MRYEDGADIRINPDALGRTIRACEDASNNMSQILYSLRRSGESAQRWAGDAVSHDVASHYTLQLWSGAHCTYSALYNYNEQLLSTLSALRQTLDAYNKSEAVAAESLDQL
jgi:hypothetical protein